MTALLQLIIAFSWGKGFKPCDFAHGILGVVTRGWMPGAICAVFFGLSGLQTSVVSPVWLKIFVASLLVAKSIVIMALYSCNGAGDYAPSITVLATTLTLNTNPNPNHTPSITALARVDGRD